MDYIYQTIIFALIAITIVNGSIIFPKTNFKIYNKPGQLKKRSNSERLIGKEIINEIHSRRAQFTKREFYNTTSIALEFMENNYPHIDYKLDNILEGSYEDNIANYHFSQSIDGMEIVNTAINVNVDKLTGTVLSGGGAVWEDIKPNTHSENEQITVGQAIVELNNVMEFIDDEISADDIKIEESTKNLERMKLLNVPFTYDKTAHARKLYIATSSTNAELVWEITAKIGTDISNYFIDAYNGKLIEKQNMAADYATYRVVKLNKSNIYQNRVDITDPFINDFSPYGWHRTNDIDFTSTVGNNVIVFENGDGDKSFDGNQNIDGGEDLKFVFAFDENNDVEGNLRASATNAFYIANMVHDLYARWGFTEEYGNFQYQNYGDKGKAGDPIIIYVNDRSGKNNAQMSVPPDGISPELRLFPIDMYSVERDPAFDNEILIHELTHGLTRRLIGGPNKVECVSNDESKSINEGFSDFFAEALQYTRYKDRNTPFRIFSYAFENMDARKYPISSDRNIDPVMYASITHASGKKYDVYMGGVLWSTILHEIFYNMVESFKAAENYYSKSENFNYSPSNVIFFRLVIRTMKEVPCNPTFISIRNSMIEAVEDSYNDDAILCQFWIGFAKRGLGTKAKECTNDNGDFKCVNDFTVPTACRGYVNY